MMETKDNNTGATLKLEEAFTGKVIEGREYRDSHSSETHFEYRIDQVTNELEFEAQRAGFNSVRYHFAEQQIPADEPPQTGRLNVPLEKGEGYECRIKKGFTIG